jgi:CheY-like chemotaxis protein
MKILLVDDDPFALRVLTHRVESLAHWVVTAPDGQAALDMWQQDEAIRVIISDWMMPRCDGLALCKAIRAVSARTYTYFIMLSARGDSYKQEPIDAGVDDFLPKPAELSELKMRLYVAQRILKYTQQIRTLQELLPICSYCKKIRNDQDYWEQLDTYLIEKQQADFSHSICPDCYKSVIQPQLDQVKKAPKP